MRERAFAIAEDLGDFGLRVLSPFFLGRVDFALGDYNRARDFLHPSVASLGAVGPSSGSASDSGNAIAADGAGSACVKRTPQEARVTRLSIL
jgi:hypothetical protein